MGNDRVCSQGAVGLAFVIGGLAGAAVALLLAPQSGREVTGAGARVWTARRSAGP